MEKGIGRWTNEDIVRLKYGNKPDGSIADHQQVMAEKDRRQLLILFKRRQRGHCHLLTILTSDRF